MKAYELSFKLTEEQFNGLKERAQEAYMSSQVVLPRSSLAEVSCVEDYDNLVIKYYLRSIMEQF